MRYNKKFEEEFIQDEVQFNKKLESSSYLILYLLVDWSGQERQSRQVIIKAIESLNEEINFNALDCSNQSAIDYLVNWFEVQDTELRRLPYQGNGELLFIKTGQLHDVIRYPFMIGAEKVKNIIRQRLQEV